MTPKFLVWGLVVLAVGLLVETFLDALSPVPADMQSVQAVNKPTEPAPQQVVQSNCQPQAIPENGAVRIHEPAVMRRTDIKFSGMNFQNHHATGTIVALLKDDRPLASMFVSPGDQAMLAAPVGRYELQVAWGTQWCNDESRFADGRLVRIMDSIENREGQTAELIIESVPDSAAGVRLVQVEHPLAKEPVVDTLARTGSEVLELRADPQGHYRVGGKINGHPATFLVDTGATAVTISRRFADEAGITHCSYGRRSETANGPVEVCTAAGLTIEFGPFRAADVEVGIVPNMAVDALLGMSVLRSMEIRQSAGVLQISRH